MIEKSKTFKDNQNDQPNTGKVAKVCDKCRKFAHQKELGLNFHGIANETLNISHFFNKHHQAFI